MFISVFLELYIGGYFLELKRGNKDRQMTAKSAFQSYEKVLSTILDIIRLFASAYFKKIPLGVYYVKK